MTIIGGCALSLKELNLSFIPSVNNEILNFIGMKARSVEVLELWYCKGIGNFGILALCEGLSGFMKEFRY